jgi:hypothetical protein
MARKSQLRGISANQCSNVTAKNYTRKSDTSCRSVDPSKNSPSFNRRYHRYKDLVLVFPNTPSMLLGGWLGADLLGCFKFLETKVNWLAAQQKCEAIGGYLAEPQTTRFIY